MKIYVACLASYNNGVLHGKWIDASTDVDEMSAEIAAMLRASPFPNVTVKCPDCDGTGGKAGSVPPFRPSHCYGCKGTGSVPSAEEWAIHDYENMPNNLGEYASLNEIATYVELTEHVGDQSLAEAMYKNGFDRHDYDDNYVGTYESFKDYADEAADDMLYAHEVSGTIRNYFDYEAWARDLKHEMMVLETANGEAVFYV